jgi:hypothetical protein
MKSQSHISLASTKVPENLFRKITDEERAEWPVRFAGVQT